MPKRSVVAAVISVLLCVGPAVAAGDGPADQGELLVGSIVGSSTSPLVRRVFRSRF